MVCAMCKNPLGLGQTRHRGKLFCSKACTEVYDVVYPPIGENNWRWAVALIVMLAIALGLILFIGNANAEEGKPTIGTGVICDTSTQLEEVISLTNKSRDFYTSMEQVNAKAEGDINVCSVSAIAYTRGETIKTLYTIDGPRDLVKITVVGLPVGQMGDVIIIQPMPPLVQYTVFASEGEG